MLSAEDVKKIGGSDVGALVGFGHKKPIDIWRRVVEGVELEDNAILRRGRRLEPVVRAEYEDATGAKLFGPQSLSFEGRPYLRASLDDLAEVQGERRVVELKTANFRQAHLWGDGDDVPPAYLCQVNFYMAAAQLKRADLAVLLGGMEFRVYTLDADAELQELLLAAAERFWKDFVLTGRPPPADESDAYADFLAKRYPRSAGPLLESTPEVDLLVAQLREAEADFEYASDRIDKAKNSLKGLIGNAEGVVGRWGRISWKNNKDSQSTDWRGLCAELRPDPELVGKHTTTKSGPRVFRCTWAKES